MKLLAIDPGDTESAYLRFYEGEARPIDRFEKIENPKLLATLALHRTYADHLAIEMVACYGMPVGANIFNTCVWIGRFIQAWGGSYSLVYRKDVKMHLCHTMRARDANIRQALIDRFGPPGTKKNPGHTYGISADIWSALAIAVTYAETKVEVPV